MYTTLNVFAVCAKLNLNLEVNLLQIKNRTVDKRQISKAHITIFAF